MITYYLSSLDSIKFAPVRECMFLKKLRFSTGKECVLVKLSPPVIGQDYNMCEDIEEFVLANRYEGESLFPIRNFPCFVFVARPLINNIKERDQIVKEELEIVGWAELYRTKIDAETLLSKIGL